MGTAPGRVVAGRQRHAASSFADTKGEILPLRVVVCKPRKRIIVDIMTPALEEIIAQAHAAGATERQIQQAFADHRATTIKH
jgi:hypothetical protein